MKTQVVHLTKKGKLIRYRTQCGRNGRRLVVSDNPAFIQTLCLEPERFPLYRPCKRCVRVAGL